MNRSSRVQPNGHLREPDDFQPRANLKQAFEEGKISLSDNASMVTFCNKFIVKEQLVTDYLQHLVNLK